MAYSTRQRRLGLLALAVVLAVGDIVLLGLSSLRFFADRGSPLRRRYRDWFIEAEGSVASAWKAMQALLVAAFLVALWRRTTTRWPLPWAALFANLGLAIGTRYHDDIGVRLAEIVGRGSAIRWAEIWMILTTGGLIALAFALAPRAKTTWQLAAITFTLLCSAVLLDLASDGADTRRERILAIHVEGLVEFALLGLAVLLAAHLALPRAEAGSVPGVTRGT